MKTVLATLAMFAALCACNVAPAAPPESNAAAVHATYAPPTPNAAIAMDESRAVFQVQDFDVQHIACEPDHYAERQDIAQAPKRNPFPVYLMPPDYLRFVYVPRCVPSQAVPYYT